LREFSGLNRVVSHRSARTTKACGSRLSAAVAGEFGQRICKAPGQIRKRGTISFAPIRKHPRQEPAAGQCDGAHHLSPIARQLRRPSAPVRLFPVSHNEIQAFEPGELTTDRRVVAPHQAGQLRDAERAPHAERNQQRKQGAVENDPGLAQQDVVALRAVEEPDEIDQRTPQSFQIACILHLYAASPKFHIACMIHAYTILVIVGSTRAQRLCSQIAEWVAEIGRAAMAAQFEIVDLRDWPLPMDDEPDIPARGDYTFEHTRAWSRKISEAHGFVFVTPQYNWGYPAPLKNALDHLYKEWSGKPAIIVTYGGHRGSKCARQLRQVLKGLKMRPVATMPGFRLTHDRIKANTGTIDPSVEFGRHRRALQQALAQLATALRSKQPRSGQSLRRRFRIVQWWLMRGLRGLKYDRRE